MTASEEEALKDVIRQLRAVILDQVGQRVREAGHYATELALLRKENADLRKRLGLPREVP